MGHYDQPFTHGQNEAALRSVERDRLEAGRNMTGEQAVRARVLVVGAFAVLLALAAATAGYASAPDRGHASAHAARVLSVRDEGRLRFVRASGSLLLDEGRVNGSFPGVAKARFVYDGAPNVTAHFTISGSGGSISATGTARLSSPTSPTPSFRGRMQVTGGTGRYAHIHGGGELFGVFNRRNYSLTVQAVGKLPY
jgi:hypothetical protein